MLSTLKKELADFDSSIIIGKEESLDEVNLNLIRFLSSQDKLVFVSFRKHSSKIKNQLIKSGVNRDNISFIDINSPLNLIELSMKIEDLLEKNSGFLIFDSINSILLYNNIPKTYDLLNHIKEKSHMNENKPIFIASKPMDHIFLKCFSNKFDTIIDLTKQKKKKN